MSVTVAITCYNEKELLFRAYESLKRQTDKDFEIIIINDCSPCSITNECCKKLERNGVKIIWRPINGGLSAARNDSFKFAMNEIVVPLDADDTLPPSALKDI